MIKNIFILIFFISMVAGAGKMMADMGEQTTKFKAGLKQHLLRNNHE